MDQKFIKTQDTEIANKLTQLGFKQLPCVNEKYVFINDGNIKMAFSDSEMKKMHFTNRLNL